MKKIKLTQNKYALVDNKDYVDLSKHKWQAEKSGKTFYAVRTIRTPKGRTCLQMHRYIINAPKGMLTDHIDGNGLNNQKKNLRLATASDNARNRGKQKNNTSGFKGVSYCKRDNVWRAQIRVFYKDIILGAFKEKELAYKAYIKACKKYHKNFANYN